MLLLCFHLIRVLAIKTHVRILLIVRNCTFNSQRIIAIMSNAPQEAVFQFVPLASFVQGSFWHKLTETKLDVDRLSDASRPVTGFYSNSNSVHCVTEVDCTSFNRSSDGTASNVFTAHGVLHNKNTVEDFKAVDKVALLQTEGLRCWDVIRSGDCLRDPSLLSQFIVLSFADLKKHHFYYWFAFPAPIKSIATTPDDASGPTAVNELLSADELKNLNQMYSAIVSQKDKAFFVVDRSDGGFTHKTLAETISVEKINENFSEYSADKVWFGFSDPSCFENAGWSARLLLCMLAVHCPNLRGKQIRLLSVRCKNGVSLEPSRLYTVRLSADAIDDSWLSFVGWEKNDQQKMLPRMTNMAASMDPERLAKTSVDLNLKLMKWRLMPTLDLDAIAGTKCLLMGAGTLGCAVARNLLAWGVKHITFVDNGKVSYSNPVRQNLYTFDDAMKSRDKAPTAAQRLGEICPGLQTVGHSMHIPMPGHPIGADPKHQAKTAADIEQLKALVQQHDVVFLLTDSRESRWLPTLLGAFYDKIVVNAALGFDSYLVMRHGSRRRIPIDEQGSVEVAGLKCIGGGQLGCYFCNDITAPGNSLKDRTLDQQCTVTRPGVSNIAAGLVVELLISLLQHPLVQQAPAYIVQHCGGKSDGELRGNAAPSVPEGLLGIVAHSIRGQLSSFEHILPATERFGNCIACSEKVLAEFGATGHEFLNKVFDSTKYLEDLTGINESFHYRDDECLLELSDSDDSQ